MGYPRYRESKAGLWLILLFLRFRMALPRWSCQRRWATRSASRNCWCRGQTPPAAGRYVIWNYMNWYMAFLEPSHLNKHWWWSASNLNININIMRKPWFFISHQSTASTMCFGSSSLVTRNGLILYSNNITEKLVYYTSLNWIELN